MLIGVGFKPPFVWSIFFLALTLFIVDKRKFSAIVLFVFGVLYLYFAISLAQTGFYSKVIYQFEPTRFLVSIASFLKHVSPVSLVLVFIFFAFPFRLRRNKADNLTLINIRNRLFELNRAQWVGIQLLLSGFTYLATLLPRGIGPGYGYYFGAPIFLLVSGLLIVFTVLIGDENSVREKSFKFNMAVSFGISVVIFVFSIHSFIARNLALHQFKEWARENNSEKIVLATNSHEVAFRLKEILMLRNVGPWNGKIQNLIFNTPVPPGTTHYLVFADQVPPNTKAMNKLVWSRGSAKLFLVDVAGEYN